MNFVRGERLEDLNIVASATASASIANVAVGFDILGHAFGAASDTVTVTRDSRLGVHLGEVSGLVSSLPLEVEKNTALAAAAAMLEASDSFIGIRVSIEKGVPMSAGIGGVGGVRSGSRCDDQCAARRTVHARAAHSFRISRGASSDPPPWDNVLASLFGGLILVARQEPPLIQRLKVPDDLLATGPSTGGDRNAYSAGDPQSRGADAGGH